MSGRISENFCTLPSFQRQRDSVALARWEGDHSVARMGARKPNGWLVRYTRQAGIAGEVPEEFRRIPETAEFWRYHWQCFHWNGDLSLARLSARAAYEQMKTCVPHVA